MVTTRVSDFSTPVLHSVLPYPFLMTWSSVLCDLDTHFRYDLLKVPESEG